MALKDLMDMKSSDKGNSDKLRAKMEVIEELRKMASEMMGEGMGDSMKKVTVASPSEEGLKKGLDLAEDTLESQGGEMLQEDEMTPEEIEAKIQELMDMKRKMEESY